MTGTYFRGNAELLLQTGYTIIIRSNIKARNAEVLIVLARMCLACLVTFAWGSQKQLQYKHSKISLRIYTMK